MQPVSCTEDLLVCSSAFSLQCLRHFLLCHFCAIDKGFYPHLLLGSPGHRNANGPLAWIYTGSLWQSRGFKENCPRSKKPLRWSQSCMAMELLPERKELWEDCRASHSLVCGRGNWGVATCSWLYRESEQRSDLGLWFPHLLLIILHLQPKGDVNIQHWNIRCCWKRLHSGCVRISALVLLIFCLEMLLQLAISLGKMLLFSFTPDSGEKKEGRLCHSVALWSKPLAFVPLLGRKEYRHCSYFHNALARLHMGCLT